MRPMTPLYRTAFGNGAKTRVPIQPARSCVVLRETTPAALGRANRPPASTGLPSRLAHPWGSNA